MTGNDIDDEILMAYADGELDASDAARVEAALRDDPQLTQRLAVFAGTREALTTAAGLRRSEPVPEHVLARARSAIDAARNDGGSQVVSFARPDRKQLYRPVMLAASLAVAAFLGGYFIAPTTPDAPHTPSRLAILNTPGLSDALARVPAGETAAIDGAEITPIASFRDANGAFCREFELEVPSTSALVSVACWSETGWEARLAIVTSADSTTQYAPASSLETLDAYLTSIGASAPLDIGEEQSALEGLQ